MVLAGQARFPGDMLGPPSPGSGARSPEFARR